MLPFESVSPIELMILSKSSAPATIDIMDVIPNPDMESTHVLVSILWR